MDYTSISAAAKRFEEKAENDKGISVIFKKIAKKIEERLVEYQMQRHTPCCSLNVMF